MKSQKIAKPIGIFLVLAMLAMLFPPNAFAAPAPSVTAASAVVIHAGTGEALYEKNADTLRVPASMTKLMTAYIIYESLPRGTSQRIRWCPSAKWRRINRGVQQIPWRCR